MNSPSISPTPARVLVEYIVREFSVDGAHMLMMGYGDNSYLGFGKFRGQIECVSLSYTNFIKEVEDKIRDRPGYLSFLCLTSYVGALPPEEGQQLIFNNLREPRKRYGWLINDSIIRPLSAHSLKSMVNKEHKVKLSSSKAPVVKVP